ncbi:MAG: acylphosphatase [Armatimonadetes bacterium]|nr:acylphosphatase [Armatimonadota bacterium]
MSSQKRVHAVVQGRAQGVGFRYFVAEIAAHLQLTGVCRNLRNGDVEVIAEGEEGALEALVAALNRGPGGSRVDNVHVVWFPPTGEFRTFRIGSTR